MVNIIRLASLLIGLSFFLDSYTSDLKEQMQLQENLKKLNQIFSPLADGFLKQFNGAKSALKDGKDIDVYQKQMEQKINEMRSVLEKVIGVESSLMLSSLEPDELNQIKILEGEGTRAAILDLFDQLIEKNVFKYVVQSEGSVNFIQQALDSFVNYAPGMGGFEDVGEGKSIAASDIQLGGYKKGLKLIVDAAIEGKMPAPRDLVENQNQFPFTTLQDQIDFMKEKGWSPEEQASFLQLASIFYHYNDKDKKLEKNVRDKLFQLIHGDVVLHNVSLAPYYDGKKKGFFHQTPFAGSGVLSVEFVKQYKDQPLEKFLKDFCVAQLSQLKSEFTAKHDLALTKRYKKTVVLCNKLGCVDSSKKDIEAFDREIEQLSANLKVQDPAAKFAITTQANDNGEPIRGIITGYKKSEKLPSRFIIYEKPVEKAGIIPQDEPTLEALGYVKKVKRPQKTAENKSPVPIVSTPTDIADVTDLTASNAFTTMKLPTATTSQPAAEETNILIDPQVQMIDSWPKSAEKAKIAALQLLAAYDYNREHEHKGQTVTTKYVRSKDIFNELRFLGATLPAVHEQYIEVDGEQMLKNKIYRIEGIGDVSDEQLNDYVQRGNGDLLQGFCKELEAIYNIMNKYEESPANVKKERLLMVIANKRASLDICSCVQNEPDKIVNFIQRLEQAGLEPKSTAAPLPTITTLTPPAVGGYDQVLPWELTPEGMRGIPAAPAQNLPTQAAAEWRKRRAEREKQAKERSKGYLEDAAKMRNDAAQVRWKMAQLQVNEQNKYLPRLEQDRSPMVHYDYDEMLSTPKKTVGFWNWVSSFFRK